MSVLILYLGFTRKAKRHSECTQPLNPSSFWNTTWLELCSYVYKTLLSSVCLCEWFRKNVTSTQYEVLGSDSCLKKQNNYVKEIKSLFYCIFHRYIRFLFFIIFRMESSNYRKLYIHYFSVLSTLNWTIILRFNLH